MYCGLNDILHNTPHEQILDNGALIRNLKGKYLNMKPYVCEKVPAPQSEESQTEVEQYKEQLHK